MFELNYLLLMARKTQIIELEDSDADTVSSISDDNDSVVSSDGNESDDDTKKSSKKTSKKLKATKNTKASDSEDSDDETKNSNKVSKKTSKKTSKKLKTANKNKNIETSDSEDSDDETTKKSVKKSSSKPTKKLDKKNDSSSPKDSTDFSLEKILENFDEKLKAFSQIENKFTTLQNEVKEFSKEYKNALRILKKEYHVVQITLDKEFKLISKQKKKTATNRKKGGITQDKPVPVKLCKYLGLDEDTKLPRSQVTKKCYDEFKKRGMSMGDRIYKFDKETSKIFGKKKDEEFHIQAFQTILKGIYDEELENRETI